jgi:hypothetical protein
MCGLAGVAGNTNAKIRDAFLDLLLITQLRGRDATGVFTVSKDGAVSVAKEVGPPHELFDRKSFDQAMIGVPKIMAGHCRAKTVGENSRLNAHPYAYDDIVGMHNGTLRNYYQMEGYDHKRTDSYVLYHNIDRYGVQETVRKLDPYGAWALVWWDMQENRLNFLRNDKRPLWFTWNKEKDAMFWCSEPWMFSALARHIDLWDGKEEGKEPVSPYMQLPVDTLWSFSVNGRPKAGEKFMTFHQPMEIKAEGKEPVGFYHGGYKGGEVPRPFPGATNGQTDPAERSYQTFLQRHQERVRKAASLDDPVDDISPVAPTTTKTTETQSGKNSSNVLDFRMGLQRTRNSSTNTLSLPSKSSKPSPQSSNGSGIDSSVVCSKTELPPSARPFPQVSLRTVAGVEYISHNVTGQEIPLQEFEARTGSKCSHCKKPIGGLEEVAAFTDKAMSGFICNTCLVEPVPAKTSIVLVG